MLNYIWLALVLLAVTIGGWNDWFKDVTAGAIDGAKTAVTIALGLTGIMALWLGLMRLAERAGIVQRMAHGLRPLMRRLFPDVPSNHPAMGSMLMNMAANVLGLGNAATPLGLRAIPFLLSFFPIDAVARRLKVYDEFVEGAKEAFNVILKVIPFLVTILVAIGIFKGAGGIDLLTQALGPILTPLHFPTELVPACIDAAAQWKRNAGAVGRYRASVRTGKHHRSHGGDHLRKHRDDILCRDGLFWIGRHQTNAAWHSGWIARRSHRRDRVSDYMPGGALNVKTLNCNW